MFSSISIVLFHFKNKQHFKTFINWQWYPIILSIDQFSFIRLLRWKCFFNAKRYHPKNHLQMLICDIYNICIYLTWHKKYMHNVTQPLYITICLTANNNYYFYYYYYFFHRKLPFRWCSWKFTTIAGNV